VAYTDWTAHDSAQHIAVPREHDDKYTRGVLGIITGSEQYPGAAVIGVDAALHTGVGMVRYIGPPWPSQLVLSRRPEAVAAAGRVQAWLLGSGMDPQDRDLAPLEEAIAQGLPTVLDGGALDLHSRASGPIVATPHYRELARMLDTDAELVAESPDFWARSAADDLGITVLLKGHTTFVAGPGIELRVQSAPTWLATAGAGDALGGILGALLATHASSVADDPQQLARLAATAATIHGLAATRANTAAAGGPFTILELSAQLPSTVGELLSRR
jgi:NAD(P)H-hydrate repair Nnr-like enzyme with NAD(P)H-hydrate dehydratase domain